MNQLFCLQHRGDRYLGMMTAMTQVPVPTTSTAQVPVPSMLQTK